MPRNATADYHAIELGPVANRFAGKRVHIQDFRWVNLDNGGAEVMISYCLHPSDEAQTQYFEFKPGIARRVRELVSLGAGRSADAVDPQVSRRIKPTTREKG
jgi:hypothetical protein